MSRGLCEVCGEPFERARIGRPRETCKDACRQAKSRRRGKLPDRGLRRRYDAALELLAEWQNDRRLELLTSDRKLELLAAVVWPDDEMLRAA